jgi:shikimate dehydrogenase
MKKYIVIGNPIEHSLSPKLHNYWIKENNLDAVYEKRQVNKDDITGIIKDMKEGKIDGLNVTLPFKKTILPYLEELTPLANKTQSVNTIYKKKNKVIGHNTDVGGFELSLNRINYKVKNKRVIILGAGGVAPSIILALKKMEASKITISNRTQKKAEDLKKMYPDIEVISWGKINDFDMIINATSLGLKNNDEIKLNYNNIGKNKLFYDVIYNPTQTNFLLKAKKLGNQVENGKMMFIYQAQLAFAIWHDIDADIDDETTKLLNS